MRFFGNHFLPKISFITFLCGSGMFALDSLALDRAIAIACFCGFPLWTSSLIFLLMVFLPVPFLSGIHFLLKLFILFIKIFSFCHPTKSHYGFTLKSIFPIRKFNRSSHISYSIIFNFYFFNFFQCSICRSEVA